jgi:hypothetical protein
MMTETEILDKVREVVMKRPERLRMASWHGEAATIDPAKELAPECGTTHCLAGWAQVFTGDDGDPQACGERMLPRTCKTISLFAPDTLALAWLVARGYADGVAMADVAAEYERRGGRVLRDGEHEVTRGDVMVLGSPKITQSGGLVRTYGTSAPVITQRGGAVRTYGTSAPVITQSGGDVWTCDTSAPVITQSGGDVWTYGTSAPVITQRGGAVRTYGTSAPVITQSGGLVRYLGDKLDLPHGVPCRVCRGVVERVAA